MSSTTGRLQHLQVWGHLTLWLGIIASISTSRLDAQSTTGRTIEAKPVPEPLRFANALLRDRRYDLAADQYERFLKTGPFGPDAAEARFGLGRARLFLNDYPAARREFEEFLRLAPQHPNAATAAFRVGEAAYLMNDLAAARKALEFYTETYPDHAHRDSAWPELGDTCFKLNDMAGAKRAYLKALEIDPKGRLANRSRFHLGRTLGSLGEIDEATKVLAALAEANDPEWSGKARLQAGQILLSSGKAAEAAAMFAEIERLKPPGVALAEARLRRAEALIKLDRRDEAEALLTPLATEGSRLVAPPAAFALAGSRFDSGRWADARTTCDEAIARAPESPWVPRLLYRSAEALVKEGKPDDARVRFLKVAADFPKDAWAASALLRAARIALDGRDAAGAMAIVTEFPSRFPGHALRIDARILGARAALALDRPKEAVAALEPLLAEAKPGTEVAQSASYYLGLAYRADGQTEKAAKLLGELAKMADTPASVDAKLLVGIQRFEAKAYDEAVSALDGYLAARPKGDDAPQALAYLALARQAMNQPEAAKAALDRLATEWPKSDALIRSRMILAESALEAKRYEDAAAMFRPASESDDPKWKARALSGLGWALLQGNHPEEAAATFSTLLAFAPTDPLAADASLARGQALEALGKTDEALAALADVSKTYAKSPQADAARVARARLLSRLGKAAEAADMFRDLLQTKSKDPVGGMAVADLLVEWGWALHDSGRTGEADAVFRRILDETPDSPRTADARVFLAESIHAGGKPDAAATLLEPLLADAVKADPVLVQTALLRVGRIDLARGDAAKAATRFDRLIKDFPDGKFTVEARLGKAESDLKLGKADAAEGQFAAIARETGPEAAKSVLVAKVRRIQCLISLEKWDDALKAADAFKAEMPTLSPAQIAELEYSRGRSLQGQARFDEARSGYQAAIESLPNSEIAARSQFMRGETYFHQKNYVESLREFHKTDLSYQVPEWQAAALLEAGKVYEQLNRWSEAIDVYQKIVATFPKDARIDDVNRRLAAAKKKIAAPPEEPPGEGK